MTNQMSEIMTEGEFLQHYGKKGMKWGVLRGQAASGSRGAQKKLDKADGAWNKEIYSVKGWANVNNHMADKMNNGGIAKFNANPKYAKIKDFNDFSDLKVQGYHADYAKLATKVFEQSAKELYGESPSGRYSITYEKNASGEKYMNVVDNQAISHANSVTPMRIDLLTDPKTGQILGIKTLDDGGEIKHLEMLTEGEFLQHYGKKGMKWGQRKSASGNSIHTSADAARTNKIKTRIKKNGLDNLSNDDLAKLNKRSQLVSEYKKNNQNTFQKGQKAVKGIVSTRKDIIALVAAGTAVVASPMVRKGAIAVVSALRNL